MQALLDAIARLPLPGPDAQRVFHGRGGLYPGAEAWTLDWYAPVWLLTHFGPHDPAQVAQAGQALADRWHALAPGQPLNWVFQCRDAGQHQTTVMAGTVPDPHVVSEQGCQYLVHLTRGQNHGLFLDMAEGRRWVRAQAAGQSVLNLFAYTCAFSVAALQGGARSVINLDMAAGALAIGQRNHALNGLQQGARFLAHNLFHSWGKVTRLGPYGLVVVDPPAYQKGSFVAGKDYPRLLRRLPELLAPGGHALLCLSAPEWPLAFLQDALAQEAPSLQLVQRLPNPVVFADVSDDRALKVLVVRQD